MGDVKHNTYFYLNAKFTNFKILQHCHLAFLSEQAPMFYRTGAKGQIQITLAEPCR